MVAHITGRKHPAGIPRCHSAEQRKTLLVIAHRLSTIQNADQIVVLKKGQIVDCGKQEELLERCPLYADMWQAHIGAKNWSVGEKKEVAVNV